MKARTMGFVTILTVAAFWTNSLRSQNQQFDRSVNTSSGDIADCSDIRVRYSRQPAITESQEFTLAPSQVSTLKAQTTNGGIYITGWDRNEYSVKTCKSVPDDSNATGTLRDITTANSGGQINVTGPDDRQWTASLIIMVPRLSKMDMQTQNGPLQLRDLAGDIHLRAANGPISLRNVGGVVETNVSNGPISLSGGSGDYRLTSMNGPVSITLSGNRWDGPGLEVTTRNGPLTLGLPDGYGSAIEIKMPQGSPVRCVAPACAAAMRTSASPNTIQIGSGSPAVRLSTSSGPLSIQVAKN